MTEEEKAELKDLLKEAKKGLHLGYGTLKPENRGQKISSMQGLVNDLRQTASSAGTRAAQAILARVAAIEEQLKYWKSEKPEQQWQVHKKEYEEESGLVEELAALIPPDPDPPPTPPEDDQ